LLDFSSEPGTHTLIFSAPGLATAASQGVVVSQPLPPVDIIGQELVGSDQVSPEHEAYLDAMGNADGVFNLGDFIALLDRTGVTQSRVAARCASSAGGSACRSARSTTGTRRLP